MYLALHIFIQIVYYIDYSVAKKYLNQHLQQSNKGWDEFMIGLTWKMKSSGKYERWEEGECTLHC